jgi:sulfoxide reductase heme-binding subunit YedZ
MQRWLLIHKTQIIKVWYAGLIAWFTFFLISLNLLTMNQWLWFGRQAATVAIVVFWLTLMPGILKRLKIAGPLLPLRTLMMLYRRQMGITMYVFASTHLVWSRFWPIFILGGHLWQFSTFELMGVTAFLLLTPVFITSNEWSVRTMGHWWRTVHALVYIVVWVLFLHISLQTTGWRSLGTLAVASIELFSLIWNKLQTPAPVNNSTETDIVNQQ